MFNSNFVKKVGAETDQMEVIKWHFMNYII